MKRGFTLIEITIVMAIMGTIMGASLLSIKYYKYIQNKIMVDYNCNEVISFINNSKMYCKENSCSAVITFDKIGNKIMLDRGLYTVNKLILPKNISLSDLTGTQWDDHFLINRRGATGDAGSITLMDNNKKIYIIRMGVGTVYVDRE